MKEERNYIKGFSYGFMATRGEYASQEAFDSLRKLRETGTEWIALCMVVMQKKYNSTEIFFDYNRTPTDLELIQLIDEAHRLGFKVCMKPMINCDDHLWRARITFPEEGNYWQQWFHSYQGFLKHYAQLAEHTSCEMFCLGCEMVGTEHKEEEWRSTIAEVRNIYNGPLIYNANHGKEEGIAWWDAVDYLGTSAYYPVAKDGGASVEEMRANWEKVKERVEGLHHKYNKPIVFMEIGCRSAYSCATMPWDFSHTQLAHDEEEQANFYESCMQVFAHQPWFHGFFWWDWRHRLHALEEAQENNDFAIYGKKAEKIIRKWYKA